MGLGIVELAIAAVIGLFGVAGLALAVWAVVDMAGHSDAAFQAVGSNRTAWLVGTIVATLACGLGWIPGLVYLLSVRPRLRRR